MSAPVRLNLLVSTVLLVAVLGACGVSGDGEQSRSASSVKTEDDQDAGFAFGGEDDSNSGDRPSASEITAAFEQEVGGALPLEVSECIGAGLHDSDLPNGVLRALIEGREAEVDEDNLDVYENTVETIAVDCATYATGD